MKIAFMSTTFSTLSYTFFPLKPWFINIERFESCLRSFTASLSYTFHSFFVASSTREKISWSHMKNHSQDRREKRDDMKIIKFSLHVWASTVIKWFSRFLMRDLVGHLRKGLLRRASSDAARCFNRMMKKLLWQV